MNDSDPHAALQRLFKVTHKLIQQCEQNRDGEIRVRCSRDQDEDGTRGFQICFCAPIVPFFIAEIALKQYLQKPPSNHSITSQSFKCFESGLLEILGRTGYGHLLLEFSRGRGTGTIFICSTTISERRIL
jgi:hypothetical protein